MTELPFLFEQLPQSYGNSNPAFAQNTDRGYIKIGYNGLNALSSNIHTGYVLSHITIRKDQKYHQPFLNVIGDKEGYYIGRMRAYTGYRYMQKLSNQWSLSGAVSVGIVNQSIKSNVAVGGASASQLDGNIGLMLMRDKMKIGISMNQIFNNSLQLYSTKTVLVRHFGLYAQRSFDVAENVKLQSNLYSRITKEQPNEYIIGTNVLYNNVLAGASYRYRFGVIVMAGIKDRPWGNNKYGFAFSYRVPIRAQIPVNANQFECSIFFRFGRKNEEGLQ